MKRKKLFLTAIIAILATALCFATPHLPHLAITGLGGIHIHPLTAMVPAMFMGKSPTEILRMANGNMSRLDGDPSGANSATDLGFKNPFLNFLGDEFGSLVNSQSQPFGFNIVNSKNAARSFYLSYGLDATIQGALKAGGGAAFAAVEDIGGDTSLAATETTGSQLISELNAFIRAGRPAFVPVIKIIASDASGFLGTSLVLSKPFNPLLPTQPDTVINMDKYFNDQYHLEFQGLREEIYLSDLTKVRFTVPASSNITFNMSIAVCFDTLQAFRSMVISAAKSTIANPDTAKQISNVQDYLRLQAKGVVS